MGWYSGWFHPQGAGGALPTQDHPQNHPQKLRPAGATRLTLPSATEDGRREAGSLIGNASRAVSADRCDAAIPGGGQVHWYSIGRCC